MGKCSVRDDWFLKSDGHNNCNTISEWARKHSDEQVFCIVCQTSISISNKGFQALTQHAGSVKHSNAVKIKLNTKQLRLAATSTTVQSSVLKENDNSGIHLYSVCDKSVISEVMWAFKCIVSNFSFSASDGITDLFQCMFSNALPKGFSMSRSKMKYLITDAIGPYFQQQLYKDVTNEYYSIIYDETTNSSGNKELQILIRYYSSSKNMVLSQHLVTYFIGKATAEILFEKIIQALDQANLPLSKMLMLGSDGPNVNKKVARLMNEEVVTCRNIKLIDIGTCNIHIIHNGFLKGVGKFGEDASQLIVAVYYYFNGWPTRWEEFTHILEELDLPILHFIKHVPSRWLTIYNSSKRLIENWTAVEKYFLDFIPKEKSSLLSTNSYKKIREALITPNMKCEVLFLQSSSQIFTNYTGNMQKEEPLVHIMYSELYQLLYILMSKICKPDKIPKSFSNVNVDELFKIENLVPVKNVVVSEKIQEEFKILKTREKDILIFLKNAQQHYLVACKHILLKSSITNSFLKNLRCLGPTERFKNRSISQLLKICKYLPFHVDTDVLINEWTLLKLEKDDEKSAELRIDHYWKQFFTKTNLSGGEKYPNVSKIVKACLSLVHGSADIERSFSCSGRILTEDRASMCERTLNAILYSKDALKHYNNKLHLVLITKELINMARGAYLHYKDYLEDKKKIQEQNKKTEEEELAKKLLFEEQQKQLKEDKNNIIEKEKSLKNLRYEENRKRHAADKLFFEANKRLKTAVSNNNIAEVEIAQAMLDGVNTIRKEEEIKKKEADTLQNILEKKKIKLIDSLSNKNEKK